MHLQFASYTAGSAGKHTLLWAHPPESLEEGRLDLTASLHLPPCLLRWAPPRLLPLLVLLSVTLELLEELVGGGYIDYLLGVASV
jgi:hypothetical protein